MTTPSLESPLTVPVDHPLHEGLTLRHAYEFPLQTLADLFTDSFQGYIGGDVRFDPYTLADFLTREGVSLSESIVAVRDDQPVGMVYLARRGWSARVAAMGVAAAHQGKRIGQWMLEAVMDIARNRRDRAIVLEVFEQNTRAVKLYEKCGFKPRQRLYAFSGRELRGEHADLQQVDVVEIARMITMWGRPDIPWQASGETLVRLGPPTIGYRMGDCGAILTPTGSHTYVIRGLAVPPESQRMGRATKLVSALVAAHPERLWYVPAICPEALAPIFTRNGFVKDRLNQFEMVLDLHAADGSL